ncbi:MAG: shikimate 5-dehydrogenase [Elusimicrobia bacterium]|nr:shikimate 5-dehydrogenase [Elusimicrobiota bacterium]
MIDARTRLFISAAGAPGNFGAAVYNELFRLYRLNAVYLPRKAGDAGRLVEAVRTLGIEGCSVTMPFKSAVIRYLDKLDVTARRTGSVNTIVNRDGVLTGHDTDHYGAAAILAALKPRSALIYGAGSVSRSVLLALRGSRCGRIAIVARRAARAGEVAKKYGILSFGGVKDVGESFDLLINATPAGDRRDQEIFGLLPCARAVLDLVVSPAPTELVRRAGSLGLKTVEGIEMAKRQLKKQFELYTGIACGLARIDRVVDSLYAGRGRKGRGGKAAGERA